MSTFTRMGLSACFLRFVILILLVFIIKPCYAFGSGEDFEEGVASVVEKLLQRRGLVSHGQDASDMYKRLAKLERKVHIMEAKDKRLDKVINQLQGEVTSLRKRCQKSEFDNNSVQNYAEYDASNKSNDSSNGQNITQRTDTLYQGSVEQIRKRSINLINQDSVVVDHTGQRYRRMIRQVAFTAYKDSYTNNAANGTIIVCNRVLLNDGNAYNTNTGTFSVPVDGVYLLAFQISAYYSLASVSLLADNAVLVSGIAAGTRTSDVMGGNVAIANLKAGQSLRLKVTQTFGASIVSGENSRYVTFSGLLLY